MGITNYDLRRTNFMENAVNKNAVACCSKRTADKAKELDWLDSALLLQLEKKLLDMCDGKASLFGGEDNGDVAIGGVVLLDYDVSFCTDVNLCPVAGGDGECGVRVYNIRFCVRGGKVISYEVRGRGKYEVFVKILPQGGVLRKG